MIYSECDKCSATNDESKETFTNQPIHDLSIALVQERAVMWGGQLCELCRKELQIWLTTKTERAVGIDLATQEGKS